jgi:NADH-quinone oxidoreductase subunit K
MVGILDLLNISIIDFYPKSFFFDIGILLFLNGLWGLTIKRHHILSNLISIEIMLLGVNICLVTSSIYLDDVAGQVFVLYIMLVSAAETVTGLALAILLYKTKGSIMSFDNLT